MTNLLLFLILVASIAEIFTLKMILKVLVQSTNFSVEDASVKATTEAVKEAKDRLPKQEK